MFHGSDGLFGSSDIFQDSVIEEKQLELEAYVSVKFKVLKTLEKYKTKVNIPEVAKLVRENFESFNLQDWPKMIKEMEKRGLINKPQNDLMEIMPSGTSYVKATEGALHTMILRMHDSNPLKPIYEDVLENQTKPFELENYEN